MLCYVYSLERTERERERERGKKIFFFPIWKNPGIVAIKGPAIGQQIGGIIGVKAKRKERDLNPGSLF